MSASSPLGLEAGGPKWSQAPPEARRVTFSILHSKRHLNSVATSFADGPVLSWMTWPWMEMTQRQPISLAPWARPPSLIAVGGYTYGHAFGGCGGTCRSAPIRPR